MNPFDDLDPRVADYMRKKQEAEAGVDRANTISAAGGIADSLANVAFAKPTIYQNNWQNMGQAPQVHAGREMHNDFTSLQKQAEMKLQGAKSDASEAAKRAFEEKKAEMIQKLQDKRIVQQAKLASDKQVFDAAEKEKDRLHAEKLAGMKSKEVDPVLAMIKHEQLKKIQNENNTPVDPFKLLPKDNQETITELSKKNASKESIANQIDAMIAQADLAKDDDAKLAIYRQMGKVLNSTEGSDAVGAEEAKRLMSKLEFAMGNIFNENPVQFGRDLPGFKDQARATSKSVRDSQKANQAVIDQKYGRLQAQDTRVIDGVKYKKAPGGWVPAE